ncbi:MAG: hypothetical protein IIY21_22715 [Clostridiales bacterium]|nr:hypothetical protein [Clostridiales bacterium]
MRGAENMTHAEHLRDVAYTLDCLSIGAADMSRSNGYWESIERCRENAEANADYVKKFIDEPINEQGFDVDLKFFILDQLARVVEYVRTEEYEQSKKEIEA